MDSVTKNIELLCFNIINPEIRELWTHSFTVLQMKLRHSSDIPLIVLKPAKLRDSFVLNIFIIHGNNVNAFHINPSSTDSEDDSWKEHVSKEIKDIFTVYMPSINQEPQERMNSVVSKMHRLLIPKYDVVNELSGVVIILHILSIGAFLNTDNKNDFLEKFGGCNQNNEESSEINPFTSSVFLQSNLIEATSLRKTCNFLLYFLVTGSMPKVN